MGAVYLAVDQELGRQVAIKVLDTALTPVDYERFRREAMAVAQMQHPYIIQIYDIGHDSNGHPYFVMEYVQGKELKDLIKTQALELPELLELFKKVTQAVGHAHSKGVLHRDLKPQNILIRNSNGDPCLLDFGLARIDNTDTKDSATLTAEGSVMGTLLYMSPEQADGVQATVQSDIWGLGATFYHILTGESPFPYSPSPYKTITSIFNLDPVVPSKVNDELPTIVDECLLSCLEKEQDDRYQSADDLLEVLESIDLNAPGEDQRPQFLIPSLLIVFGALLVVAFIGYLSLPADSESSRLDSDNRREKTDKFVEKKASPRRTDPIKKIDPPIVIKPVKKPPVTKRPVKKPPKNKPPEPKPPVKKPKPSKSDSPKEIQPFDKRVFLPLTKAPPVFRDFNGDGATDILLTCSSEKKGFTTMSVVLSGKDLSELWRFHSLAYLNEEPLTINRKSGVSIYLSQYEYRSRKLVILKLAGRTGKVVDRTEVDVAKPKSLRVPSRIYRYRFNDVPYSFVIFESAKNKVFLFDHQFKYIDRCNPKISQRTTLRHRHEQKVVPWDLDNNRKIDGILWTFGRNIFYLYPNIKGKKRTLAWKSFHTMTAMRSKRTGPAPPNLQEINLFLIPNTRSQCLATLHLPRTYKKLRNRSPWFLVRLNHKGKADRKKIKSRYPGTQSIYPFRHSKSQWRIAFGSSAFKLQAARNIRIRMLDSAFGDLQKFAGQTQITNITGGSQNIGRVILTRKNPQCVERWNLSTQKPYAERIRFPKVPENLVGRSVIQDLNGDRAPELIVLYHDPGGDRRSKQQVRVLTVKAQAKKR